MPHISTSNKPRSRTKSSARPKQVLEQTPMPQPRRYSKEQMEVLRQYQGEFTVALTKLFGHAKQVALAENKAMAQKRAANR